MAKKDFTATSKLLITLLSIGDVLSYAIGPPRSIAPIWKGRPSSFRHILYQLQRRGVLKIVNKDNQRFIKLTKKGQMEALFEKAKLPERPKKWDGKWRLVVFDIPEESHDKRNQLRQMLRKSGFIKLQVSVYISPYPLNQSAIVYLQKSKLIEYIRIARIEAMDNDVDLRKRFHL